MTPKELKKLVKTCRELGILNYKGPDFEFTLTHDAPEKPSRRATKEATDAIPSNFESDELTEEQLLYWSVGGELPFTGEGAQ